MPPPVRGWVLGRVFRLLCTLKEKPHWAYRPAGQLVTAFTQQVSHSFHCSLTLTLCCRSPAVLPQDH